MSSYAENPEASHHLTNALSLIRDVQGTLEVAELKGAALLAEESLEVVRELVSGEIKNKEEASRLVVHALIQLPDYLDYIESGKDDFPLVLVEAINELRVVRRADFISDDVASFSQLEKDEEILASQHRSGESLENVAGLTRLVFELGLLGWYQKKNVKESLRKMALVCRRLRDASEHRASRRLWWVSQALIEALYSDLLRPSAAVKSLLGKVDRQIKRLFDVGESEFSATIPIVLVKSLLSYVANSQPGNQTVDAVRHAYFLDSELPTSEALAAAGVSLSGQNNALFHSVSKALLEDIADLKDRMALDQDTQALNADDVEVVGSLLNRLIETLDMLGLKGHTQRIAELNQAFKTPEGKGRKLQKEDTEELATALVEIERAVEAFGVIGRAGAGAAHGSSSKNDEDYLAVRKMVVTEALYDLDQCKQRIQSYAVESRELDNLKDIPPLLSQVNGAMRLVSLNPLASLIEQIKYYIEHKLAQNHNIQDAELEKLADSMAAAEVYLEVLDTTGIEQSSFIATGREALVEIYQAAEAPFTEEAAVNTPTAKSSGKPEGDLDEIRAAFYREVDEPSEHLQAYDKTLAMPFMPNMDSPVEVEGEVEDEPENALKAPVEAPEDFTLLMPSDWGESIPERDESASDDLAGSGDGLDLFSDNHTLVLPADEMMSEEHIAQDSGNDDFTGSLFGDFDLSDEQDGDDSLSSDLSEVSVPSQDSTLLLPDEMGFDLSSEHHLVDEKDTSENFDNFTLDLSAADIPTPDFSEKEGLHESLANAFSDESAALKPATGDSAFTEALDDSLMDIGSSLDSGEDLANEPAFSEPESSEDGEAGDLSFSAQESIGLDSELLSSDFDIDDSDAFDKQSISSREQTLLLSGDVDFRASSENARIDEKETLGRFDDFKLDLSSVDISRPDSSEVPEDDLEDFPALSLELDSGDFFDIEGDHPEQAEVSDRLPGEPGADIDDGASLSSESLLIEPDASESRSVETGASLAQENIDLDSEFLSSTYDFDGDSMGSLEAGDDQIFDLNETLSLDPDDLSATSGGQEDSLLLDISEEDGEGFDFPGLVDEGSDALTGDEDEIEALQDEDDGSQGSETGLWAIPDKQGTEESVAEDNLLAADTSIDVPLTTLDMLPDMGSAELDVVDVLKDFQVLPSDIDDDIYQIFLEEFAEESEHLDESFPLWVSDRSNHDALLRARRSFHTLKGSGRLVGAQVVGEFSWYHEKILNQLIEGAFEPKPEIDRCLTAGIALLPVLKKELEDRERPDKMILKHAAWAKDLSQGHFGKHEESTDWADEASLDDELLTDHSLSSEVDAAVAPESGLVTLAEDPELKKIFIADSRFHLDMLEASLSRAATSATTAVDDGLVIAVHTLNGSARTADVSEVYLPCSSSERYLRAKQSHDLVLDSDDIALFGKLGLHVRSVLSALEEDTQIPDPSEITHQFDHLLKDVTEQQVSGRQDLEAEPQESTEDSVDSGFEGTASKMPAIMDGLAVLRPESEAQVSGLLEVFLEECGEILEACDEAMLRWKADPKDEAPVSELQRQLHTLKGGARMAGLTGIGDLSHALESLFIEVGSGKDVEPSLISVVHAALDKISEVSEACGSGQTVPSVAENIAAISQLLESNEIVSQPHETSADQQAPEVVETETVVAPVLIDSELPVAIPPTDGEKQTQLQEVVKIKSAVLDTLVDNVGEVNVFHSRVEQKMGTFGFNLQELDQTIRRLTEQLRRLEMEAEAQILHRFDGENIDPDDTGISDRFDPLELDRYSNLQQLSRSLAESTNDLSSIHQLLSKGLGDVEGLLMQQSRVSNELQEGLMRTRMSKFKLMVPRLRRVARRTAQELGKNIELTFTGDDSELDRKLLESIAVPLEHMIRNAVAHGIETPEIRVEKGKPETGIIHISITREGPEILIDIEDDGAGIDLKRVKSQAISSGLIQPGTENQLSDQQVQSLILQPGFSTAEEVSQVAGRGVGMDVVLTQLTRVKGSLEIQSDSGAGTRFRITLPFTLAINQALLLGAGSEVYAIPMGAIDGVVQVSSTVLEAQLSGEHPVLEYGGDEYQLRQLSATLEKTPVKITTSSHTLPVILTRSGEHLFAFVADQLVGNREIVVKSLSTLISRVSGISGATILGDGRVVLILDVAGLIRSEIEGHQGVMVDIPDESESHEKLRTIMVVDDSITIRKVTARMLERHNFEVVTAKDGLDAVSQLQDIRPDLMLLDIEMPRMDGFELAAHMRNTDENRSIPIIMISSRTGKKHRKQAAELGVNCFLGKPYQDTDLLENIESVLGTSGDANGH